MVDPTDYVHPADRLDMANYERGVQLRTWIAAQCMAAVVSAVRDTTVSYADAAAIAVKSTDALIAELNK